MTLDNIQAIFNLAGIPLIAVQTIPNEYWPDHPNYEEIRKANPWYIANTPIGDIKLGWRKRVISIDWSSCVSPPRGQVFISRSDKTRQLDKTWVTRQVMRADAESVTNWDTGCHAYSFGDVVNYLRRLNLTLRAFEAVDVNTLNA